MFPTINIGPFVFPTAGIVYLLGAYVALTLIERAAKRLALNVEATYGVAVVGLLVGIVAARLAFVAEYWASFSQNLIGIIWPLTSGYTVWAGLFFGVAAAFFYGRYKNLPLWPTLDALTPGLLTALIALSLADFLAGPGYGTLTSMPWGMSVFGIRRHPVQVYEIVLGVAALGVWWLVVKRGAPAGQPFLLAFALYSAGRLFLDAYRDNALLTADGYHIVQIVALALLVGCLVLLARQTTRSVEPKPTESTPV
ncbi:MAG: prolipoprotein diacylglyceryl transferase [Anaerolineae bacterium]|nr:prolipoprotein diacylglyceryl transferase [Anaerolineae bacterium]